MTVSFSEVMAIVCLVADAGDQLLQRRLAAEGRLQQVHQLDPEVKHVDRLRRDQAQVQRQLQPAAGENQAGQGTQRRAGVIQGIGVLHRGSGFLRMCAIVGFPQSRSPIGSRFAGHASPSVGCKCEPLTLPQRNPSLAETKHECYRVGPGRKPCLSPRRGHRQGRAHFGHGRLQRPVRRGRTRFRGLLGPAGPRERGLDQAIHQDPRRVEGALLQMVRGRRAQRQRQLPGQAHGHAGREQDGDHLRGRRRRRDPR